MRGSTIIPLLVVDGLDWVKGYPQFLDAKGRIFYRNGS